MRSEELLLLLFASCACAPPAPSPCDDPVSRCDGGATELDSGVRDAGPWDLVDAGDDAGDDAGADAGHSLDWRTTRGAALTTQVVGEYAGVPWALSDTGFALQSGCDAGLCELTFHDLAGAVLATIPRARGLFDFNVSPDGTLASLLEVDSAGRCTRPDGSGTDWLGGTWSLVELSTGARRLSEPGFRSARYVGASFLSSGGHVRLYPELLSTCQPEPAWRSTRAPFASPAGLPAGTYVDDELPDGRLLTQTAPETVAVRTPDGTSVALVSTEGTEYFASGGFVHAMARYPVERVASFALATGLTHHGSVAGEGLTPETASDRSLVLCGPDDAERRRPCAVLDGQGVHPRADLLVGRVAGKPQLAVAGREEFLAYVDGRTGSVTRRDLRTGVESVLSLPVGRLRAVGDGRAVVLTTTTAAWGIERERVFAFEGRLVEVLSTELVGASATLPQAQLVLVVTSSPSGAAHWLTAWNVEQRRVARLTDALYFNPPYAAPFTAATGCATPGFARSAGTPDESAGHRTRWAHFTEFVSSAHPTLRVLMVPLDLSAPPRLFAELEPERCAPPLSSPGGARLWLPVPTPNGLTRAVFANP